MWATLLRCPSCPQPIRRAGRSCLGATRPSGFCCQAPDAGVGYCTRKLENAHGTEFRELLYPWDPWFGLRVGVHAAIERSGGTVFRCSLSGSDADRWLEVPAWMFDRSACTKACLAADAYVDLTALAALALLLRHVLEACLTPSNAAVLSVPILSRDQNRRELDATSNEVEVGAPPCAATDRHVRSGPADDWRHAGVVRAANGDTNGTDRADDTVDPAACRQEPDRLDSGGRS